jgi:hypothetical protein
MRTSTPRRSIPRKSARVIKLFWNFITSLDWEREMDLFQLVSLLTYGLFLLAWISLIVWML